MTESTFNATIRLGAHRQIIKKVSDRTMQISDIPSMPGNEILSGLLFVAIIADMVLGWINHQYVLKDSSSTAQQLALIKKSVILASSVVLTSIPDLLKALSVSFQGAAWAQVSPTWITVMTATISSIIVMTLLSEVKSVVANYVQITGLELPDKFLNALGIKQEIQNKMAKAAAAKAKLTQNKPEQVADDNHDAQ